MRCLNEGQIQEFLDGQSAAAEVIQRHLRDCVDCRERVEEAQRRLERIQMKLQLLEPKMIPELSPPDWGSRPGSKEPGPLLWRLVCRPVSLPAGLVWLLVALIAALSFVSLRPVFSPPRPERVAPVKTFLTVTTPCSTRWDTLPFDLRGYSPVQQPEIKIIKEKDDEITKKM